jgi:hypothetical protein
MKTMHKKLVLFLAVMFSVALLVAATINGYLDLQVRATPGNPGAGYLRIWSTSGGLVKCVQSSGASCLFDASGGSSHGIGMVFGESGGTALSTGSSFVPMPFACTVQSTWYTYSDQGATFDIKKNGTSIVSGGAPSASAGAGSGSTSGWTTSISAGDLIEWKLLSVTSAPTTATISLGCT